MLCLLIDYFNVWPKPEESSLHANGIHSMICCPVKDNCFRFRNTQLCDSELLNNITHQLKTEIDNCNSGICKYHYDGIHFKMEDCHPAFEDNCYKHISIADSPKVKGIDITILFPFSV